MADELRSELGIESDLVEGTRGVFDVYVDDWMVFSKHREQRFPVPGEVVKLVRHAAS